MIGPPGSGKGTQAKLLAAALGAVHLSSGQVLRDHASASVKREMDRGELVREAEVDEILEASLRLAPAGKIWILDGYIRLEQDMNWLASYLEALGRKFDLVIIIDVAESVCKSRMLSRGRDDDTLEAWDERWVEFEMVTKPIINSLVNFPHVRVDGSGDEKVINQALIAELSARGISA